MKTQPPIEIKKQAEKLHREINRRREKYHQGADPTATDEVYSALMRELKKLEEKYSALVTKESPTQFVAGKAQEKFAKIAHKIPMYSLNDVFSEEELKEWGERLERIEPKILTKTQFYCEPKMDGLAVELEYENNKLIRGSTRGDGRVGENVTENLKTISNIPNILKSETRLPAGQVLNLKSFIVRGEVYLPIAEFEKINKEREKNQETLFANPRNAAAGSLKQLDPSVTAQRKLKFMAYDLIAGEKIDSHNKKHILLEKMGFEANNELSRLCKDLGEVNEYKNELEKKRDKLSYQIDGLVVQIDNAQLFEKLGVVGKAPRAAAAFKFSAEKATTKVKDVVFQVGRTGVLTPVAILEPIAVAGTTVSRATLHNLDEIKRLEIKINDTVVVQKAGDVIPDIMEVIKNLRSGKEKNIQMPEKCPTCGSKVAKKKADEVNYYCSNQKCFAQTLRQIIHFVSKPAMNIDGLGPKIIEQLLNQGLIKDETDIFQLTQSDIQPLERFAEKSSQNIIEAIENSKNITAFRFIYALGIRQVGEVMAFELSKILKGSKEITPKELFNQFSSQNIDFWQEIPDIGPEAGKAIDEYFRNQKNQQKFAEFNKADIKIILPARKKQTLAGKTFVITGSLESMTREEAEKKIRDLGGKASSSVSQETDYLVAGSEPGSKYDRAKKLGVKIISEQELLDVVK